MIVPAFWAEASSRHQANGRQVTIRRFGWSDISVADAEVMAKARAEAAMADWLSGAKLRKRDAKIPYNGGEGLPIREEIVSRHGEQIVTRNAYGARCLNSPDALFADVDFPDAPKAGCMDVALAVSALIATFLALSITGMVMMLMLAVALTCAAMVIFRYFSRRRALAAFDPEADARQAVEGFVRARPHWSVRLYRTPQGMRLLATHRRFDALEDDVRDFFKAIGVDPVYALMCLNQRCFRARLSAKPWRIGIGHIRPRPGTWPIRPEHLPSRAAWVDAYEARAQGYAACRFVGVLGSGRVDEALMPVIALHDTASRALENDLSLA